MRGELNLSGGSIDYLAGMVPTVKDSKFLALSLGMFSVTPENQMFAICTLKFHCHLPHNIRDVIMSIGFV
jgi:hypothetical protein